MSAPELSIIIPAYNVEAYLGECLDSVLSSTFRDYEILLIDDGSTDNTGHICDEYQAQHPCIRVFHTENHGLSCARNLGIDEASGRLLGFVDSDDRIATQMYARLVSEMHSVDADLAACRFNRCTRSESTGAAESKSASIQNGVQSISSALLRDGYGTYVWNKVYKRSILNQENLRFPSNRLIAEDWFFLPSYIHHCTRAVFLDEPLYDYITTDSSLMSTYRRNRVVDNRYIGLPLAWRSAAEQYLEVSQELSQYCEARAAMFYQTVLRKLRKPDTEYIEECVAYIKKHRRSLCKYSWGFKYYISALLLSANYRCWMKIFRREL